MEIISCKECLFLKPRLLRKEGNGPPLTQLDLRSELLSSTALHSRAFIEITNATYLSKTSLTWKNNYIINPYNVAHCFLTTMLK